MTRCKSLWLYRKLVLNALWKSAPASESTRTRLQWGLTFSGQPDPEMGQAHRDMESGSVLTCCDYSKKYLQVAYTLRSCAVSQRPSSPDLNNRAWVRIPAMTVGPLNKPFIHNCFVKSCESSSTIICSTYRVPKGGDKHDYTSLRTVKEITRFQPQEIVAVVLGW